MWQETHSNVGKVPFKRETTEKNTYFEVDNTTCGKDRRRFKPAHECVAPRDTAIAVRPVPRSTDGRLSPMVSKVFPMEESLPCPSWPLDPKPAHMHKSSLCGGQGKMVRLGSRTKC